MAVTLTTTDLKQPTGELSDTLFPGLDFNALLTGWLQQAKAQVEVNTSIAVTHHNAAAAAWVYYRAYAYKVMLMSSEPNDITVGERSETYSADQRKTFTALRDERYALYASYEVPALLAATPTFFGRVRANVS